MLAEIGYLSLLLALGCAAYATVVALLSVRNHEPAWLNSARRAAFLTWPLLTFAALTLILLLVTNHFEVSYVYNVTSRAMPFYLKVTALWGGQEGSLIFWSWLMSTFTGVAMLRRWERDRALMPFVIAVTMITLGFFVGLIVFIENPFTRWWQWPNGDTMLAMWPPAGAFPLTPLDGQGLNPLLRHPGMIIHPPMLYLGFVGFVIPYAFAIAALVTRRPDDEWIRTTRSWTMIGWLFLSLGLILGGRWAYDVLGWGGFWGWDPVENAALLPWLTGTAFLHSVMIQEKRGMFKRWNIILIIATYSLVIYGTFLTRSGLLSSVHAFAQSSIGPWFLGFIALMALASVGLLFRAWEALKSDHALDEWFSRESGFLLNNLLFMGITVSVFIGMHYQMFSELIVGEKVTVGPPYYNQVTGPQFAVLVLLMGVAPLLAWRKASSQQLGRLMLIPVALSVVMLVVLVILGVRSVGALISFWITSLVAATTILEFVRGTQARMKTVSESAIAALLHLIARNRRRYGGYIIHLGVVLIAIGVIGAMLFQQETQGRLNRGEQMTLGRYVLVYEGLAAFQADDDREVHRATVSVYRDGQFLTELHPRQDIYFLAEGAQPMTIPGVRSSLEDDVYVLLVGWEPVGPDGATFKVYVNPLVNWVWFGGLVFILGTVVALWPNAAEMRRAVVLEPRRARSVTASGD
jgi:cytochrome c-type biogenesis protein CcmF